MAHKGNWFEEQVLEATTGVRFYSDPKDRQAQLLTKARCIEHSDQMDPKEYKSVMSTCITNQLEHKNYKTLQDKVGPRATLLEAQMKKQVNDEFAKKQSDEYNENRKVSYMSDAMECYNKPNFTPSLDVKNPYSRVQTYNADYCTETPITYFSDAVKNGTANFPATFVTSGNPFKKSSAFSAHIVKDPLIRRAESNERPRPLPTIREFGILREMRKRLFSHLSSLETSGVAGRIVRIIVDNVWRLASGGGGNAGIIHIETLVNGLFSDFNFTVSKQERSAILMAYDVNSNNQVSLADFTDYIRGSLSPRAAELVDIVLTTIATAESSYSEGYVSESVIMAMYSPVGPNSLDVLLSSLHVSEGQVAVDDFFEYYTDVLAELDTNQQFEALIRASWGI